MFWVLWINGICLPRDHSPARETENWTDTITIKYTRYWERQRKERKESIWWSRVLTEQAGPEMAFCDTFQAMPYLCVDIFFFDVSIKPVLSLNMMMYTYTDPPTQPHTHTHRLSLFTERSKWSKRQKKKKKSLLLRNVRSTCENVIQQTQIWYEV